MAHSIASTDSGGQSSGGFAAPAPDPDIAGIGVIISFIITFVVAIGLCIDITLYQAKLRKRSPLFIKVEEKVLLGFSDQILITGFGLQLAGFIKLKGLSIYHHGIITYLASLSTSCHSLSVIVLREYFHTHVIPRRIRIGVMTISMLLLTVNIIVLQVGPSFVTSMEPTFQIYFPPEQPYDTWDEGGATLGATIGMLGLLTTFILFLFTCNVITSPERSRTWLTPHSRMARPSGMHSHVWFVAGYVFAVHWLPMWIVFSSLLPCFSETGFLQWRPAGGDTGGTSERSWGYG
ncbi:hypothetical protein IFR05_016840 [Cadophora sp. M221]|nr:hypothetical protein IFR05_016840 [Cadophora sp. M221]